MSHLPTILSAFPFVVFIFLLLWRKMSLLKTALITLAISTALTFFYWKIFPSFLWISYGKGILIAFDIFIIIFGAILFLEILRDFKVIKNISYYLETFSKDYRIQVIILAWFFEGFIEGTAGFGTPGAIVAPLLIGMGLPVIRSLIIAMLGNSTSVLFGAAGTPIRIGFAGLDYTGVPLIASVINCVGFIIPIFMLWFATAGRPRGKQEFKEALPFAIWSGVVFVVISVLMVPLFGQEFPSILGSVIALLIVMATTKLGIFVPKTVRRFNDEDIPTKSMSASRAFFPYILLILFLIIGKFALGGTSLPISFLGISHSFNLFNPGFAFIAAALVVILFWKSKAKEAAGSAWDAFKGTLSPFLVIISMSSIVQMMTNSGQNFSGLPAAITLVAKSFETSLLPFFAPFIGAFGSVLTGSATISNIMFGNFFALASESLGLSLAVILALGVVGGAAGNMGGLSDILTAEAGARVKNKEGEILKGLFIPFMIYLSLAGILGMIAIYVIGI